MQYLSHKARHRMWLLIRLAVPVALVVLAGVESYLLLNHRILLSVEGQTEKISIFGKRTVRDVLVARNIRLKAFDRVTPALQDKIKEGMHIQVAYAKPVTLIINGQRNKRMRHEFKVEDVLHTEQLRVESSDYVSPSLQNAIPREGVTIVLSQRKKIFVVADGRTREVMTASPTVADVLQLAGVVLRKQDELKPAASVWVVNKMKIRVVRIDKTERTQDTLLAFKTEIRYSHQLAKGKKKVLQAGKTGLRRTRFSLLQVDGVERKRKIVHSHIVVKPRKQIELHGVLKPSTTIAGKGSVWLKLAHCESRGNWAINTGNGFYGGLQFTLRTWRAVGGKGYPHQNSQEEQIKRGKILQARSGWGQWPLCSRKLGLR